MAGKKILRVKEKKGEGKKGEKIGGGGGDDRIAQNAPPPWVAIKSAHMPKVKDKFPHDLISFIPDMLPPLHIINMQRIRHKYDIQSNQKKIPPPP